MLKFERHTNRAVSAAQGFKNSFRVLIARKVVGGLFFTHQKEPSTRGLQHPQRDAGHFINRRGGGGVERSILLTERLLRFIVKGVVRRKQPKYAGGSGGQRHQFISGEHHSVACSSRPINQVHAIGPHAHAVPTPHPLRKKELFAPA